MSTLRLFEFSAGNSAAAELAAEFPAPCRVLLDHVHVPVQAHGTGPGQADRLCARTCEVSPLLSRRRSAQTDLHRHCCRATDRMASLAAAGPALSVAWEEELWHALAALADRASLAGLLRGSSAEKLLLCARDDGQPCCVAALLRRASTPTSNCHPTGQLCTMVRAAHCSLSRAATLRPAAAGDRVEPWRTLKDRRDPAGRGSHQRQLCLCGSPAGRRGRPMIVDSCGWTAAHTADFAGSIAPLELLLAARPDLASMAGAAPLPLALALDNDQLATACCLLDRGTLPPVDQVLDILSKHHPAAFVHSLYAILAARTPLSAAQCTAVRQPCLGIGAALPSVLARSAEEAAALVRCLAPQERRSLQDAALSQARTQSKKGVPLPADLLGRMLAMAGTAAPYDEPQSRTSSMPCMCVCAATLSSPPLCWFCRVSHATAACYSVHEIMSKCTSAAGRDAMPWGPARRTGFALQHADSGQAGLSSKCGEQHQSQ